MKILLSLLTVFFSLQLHAIELVIGDKVYYIEKFEIKDNGEKIIIPYTIHLDSTAFARASKCEQQKRIPASSTMPEGKKSNAYERLMNGVGAGFIRLSDQFNDRPKKKPYKQDFR